MADTTKPGNGGSALPPGAQGGQQVQVRVLGQYIKDLFRKPVRQAAE
jgi:hypothetical protein